MRRWLQTIAELAVAALLHVAVLAAVSFGATDRTTAAAHKKKEEERGARVRRVQLAGPGRSAESGRRPEEMPGFPTPVAAENAPEGRAVLLPAVSREQVRNASDGEQSTRRKTPATVPRPELAQTEPQLARGARGDPDWQLPGQRVKPLQLFPSPMPGPTPGKPAVKRLPPSGGSPRDAKVAVRGFEAAPRPAAPAPSEEKPAAPGARASGGGGPSGAAPAGEDQAPEEQRPPQAVPKQETSPDRVDAFDDRRRSVAVEKPSAEPAPESVKAHERAPAPDGPQEVLSQRRMDEPRPGEPAPRYREQTEHETDPLNNTTGPTDGARATGPPVLKEAPENASRMEARTETAAPVTTPDSAATTPTAPPAEQQQQSPRTEPRVAEEPSPPDPKELPEMAEAPKSDQLAPHAPRPDRNQEDQPAAEGVPGGADSQQPVLLAMAPPTTQAALEGGAARLSLPGDQPLDPAQRALASANALLELAAMEGGEVGARHAAEAAAALAAAEEALRGMEAPEPTRTAAPPQAGAVTDLPAGGGLGDQPGSPRLGGTGRLSSLAQGRVDYVVSLVGPSAARRAGHGGIGRVDFRVDERGYVREVAIRHSTGNGVLDQEIEPALHLAEPYAATPGWISVVVRFPSPR